MDLDKLARLSCLEIKEEDREFFITSLAGVFEIMDKVASLESLTENDKLTQSVTFNSLEEDSVSGFQYSQENVLIDREEQYKGIHLEQGVFLAPKVIKKD